MPTLTVRVSDSAGNETVATHPFQVGGGETIVTGHQPAGFTVPAGETWRIQGLVTSPANVVVYGMLKLRAGDTLRFVGVNEANYVGSGMVVLASDVGLWVMGPSGVLDAQGTPKVAWNRTGSDPSWLPGDVLKITPTAPNAYACTNYTGGPLPRAYPDVPPAEVLNLTRDCRIEGTLTGRSHIFISSPQVHTVEHVEISHMGPRQGDNVVIGRWGLHFHHCMEGSRGTVVEGVVLHDIGAHGFVPHMSSGIDFVSDIAFDTQGAGFWWDDGETTEDCRWIDCVAANIRRTGLLDKAATGFQMHNLAPGGVARGCVAAAINDQGTFPHQSRGFAWPTGNTDDHWIHEDNVVHNCATGIRWWANAIAPGTPPARTDRFIAYNCEKFGIDQGAYANPVRHDGAILRGNAWQQHSNSIPTIPPGQVAGGTDVDVDVNGRTTHALFIAGANLSAHAPTTFIEWKLDGATVNAVEIDVNTFRRDFEFVRCLVDGADLEFTDFTRLQNRAPFANQDWLAKVQRVDGTAFQFGPTGGSTVIPAFAG